MDVLHSPVSQQQAILMFEVITSLGCAIDNLLYERPLRSNDACDFAFGSSPVWETRFTSIAGPMHNDEHGPQVPVIAQAPRHFEKLWCGARYHQFTCGARRGLSPTCQKM